MPIFGPPNIEKLSAKGDVAGLVKALAYQKDPQIAPAAATALVELGAVAVGPLAAVARDPRDHSRWTALAALGRVADPRALEPLLAALTDQSDVVRKAAATALGTIGERRAVEPLIAALTDQSEDVRGAAQGALGTIGDPRAVEPLIASLSDKYPKAAVVALARIGDARAVEPLSAALFEADWQSRLATADALAELGDPRAVEPLIRALGDEQLAWKDARDNADFVRALGGLDPSRSAALNTTLEDQTQFVRTHAAVALGRIGDFRAVEPLRAALQAPGAGRSFREAAAAALRSIGDALEIEPLRAAQANWSQNLQESLVETLRSFTLLEAMPPTGLGENVGFVGAAHERATAPAGSVSRQPKPLIVNLGDVEESVLESIVESGTPLTIVQEARYDLVTPDLARQAIEAKYHERRADSCAQNREFKEAAEEYSRAIRTAPYEDELLFMSLGGVLSELHAYPEALRYLETASSINPLNEDVARNLKIARTNAGQD
jgi:HEAT repeat protein